MASSLIDWLASLLNQRVVDELKSVETVLLRVIAKNDQILAQLDWQRLMIEANKATGTQSLELVRALAAQLMDGPISGAQMAELEKTLKTSADELSKAVTENEATK